MSLHCLLRGELYFLHVDDVRTSQETQIRAPAICYGDRFYCRLSVYIYIYIYNTNYYYDFLKQFLDTSQNFCRLLPKTFQLNSSKYSETDRIGLGWS
jgi:hypothetical protein